MKDKDLEARIETSLRRYPEVASVLDQLRSALEEVEEDMERIERHRDADIKDDAQWRDEHARAARAGELGSDWQAVQRRIDSGRSSLADVFAGRDESPEARRLRDLSRRNLAELGRVLRQRGAVDDVEDV